MCAGAGYAMNSYRRGRVLEKTDLSLINAEMSLSHFNKEISDELEEYVTNTVLSKSRYLFLSRVKKIQVAYCTHCEQTSVVNGVKHGQKIECPSCKSECIAKSAGRGRGTMIDTGIFTFYEKSRIKANTIVARTFHARRDYRNAYIGVKTEIITLGFYIFELGEKPILIKGNYGSGYYKTATVYSIADNQSWSGYFHKALTVCCSKNSIEKAVEGSAFKYSCWERFEDYHTDFIKYFALFCEYPKVEYMIKNGLFNIVLRKLNDVPLGRTVRWKAETIEAALGVKVSNLKELVTKNIEIDVPILMLMKASNKFNWNMSIDLMLSVKRHFISIRDVELFLAVAKYVNPVRIMNYAAKQGELNGNRIISGVVSDWNDYIKECKELETKLTDQVLFPKNLDKAHKETSKRVKIKINKEIDEKMKKRVTALKKYRFENDNLIIRPAQSTKELISEGNTLGHCVGGYAEDYAKGIKIVMVLRRKSQIEEPYYTIEIRDNRIAQASGLNRAVPTQEVKDFLELFKQEKLIKNPRKSAEREVVECRI